MFSKTLIIKVILLSGLLAAEVAVQSAVATAQSASSVVSKADLQRVDQSVALQVGQLLAEFRAGQPVECRKGHQAPALAA